MHPRLTREEDRQGQVLLPARQEVRSKSRQSRIQYPEGSLAGPLLSTLRVTPTSFVGSDVLPGRLAECERRGVPRRESVILDSGLASAPESMLLGRRPFAWLSAAPWIRCLAIQDATSGASALHSILQTTCQAYRVENAMPRAQGRVVKQSISTGSMISRASARTHVAPRRCPSADSGSWRGHPHLEAGLSRRERPAISQHSGTANTAVRTWRFNAQSLIASKESR